MSVVDRWVVFLADAFFPVLEPGLVPDFEVDTVVRVVRVVDVEPDSAGVDITSPVRVTTTT